MPKQLRRGLVAGLLATFFGFTAFLRSDGSEAVRAVQIVSLLASGMGLGVALTHALLMIGAKSAK
jgi:hypothetical protein